jgi:hypothetical protein
LVNALSFTTVVYSSGPVTPVDVEAPVLAVEAEVFPHARRLDQDLGAHLGEERRVVAHLHVLADGVGDVGVDVVLGGARLVVRRGLLAVDGPPREQGPVAG